MAQRICFLGHGGSGKSTVAQNISHALALLGYRVLLVGDSFYSTALLRGQAEVLPALEAYRAQYKINLKDCILPTQSGVFCLELGSIEPGIGCLARGVNLIDEMLETQNITQGLGLDYILYDISGEIPCTGYILPIREGVMHRCILVTNGSFAAAATVNSLLQAVVKAGRRDVLPVQLLLNSAGPGAKEQLLSFAQAVNLPVLGSVEYAKGLHYSALAGKTIFAAAPQCPAAQNMRQVAQALLKPAQPAPLAPYTRSELLSWISAWQQRELHRLLEEEGQPYSNSSGEQGGKHG